MFRDVLLAFSRNLLSLTGAVITTVSAVLILVLFGLGLMGFEGSPYLGILAFLVLPALFVLGLALMPLGVWRERRRMRRAAEEGRAPPGFPIIDFNQPRTRRLLLAGVLLTMANVVILSLGTYKGVEVMDSTAFCGRTCHTVMQPEYTTYQRSPHARVKCTECHIGPGASWFVKSKLSGAWQVVAVTFDLFPRPIPTPVANLRPARETCEQCHWPSKFVGERLAVKTSYRSDEQQTEQQTVMLMKVGGMQPAGAKGIHWHVDPAVRIRYLADRKRQDIRRVELTRPDGTLQVFDGAKGSEPGMEWRTMDCVDCHNRPTHIYGDPEEQIDAALRLGQIDRGLPWIRREGLQAIRGEYASAAEARERIGEAIRGFYARDYPQLAQQQAGKIEAAAAQLGDIYSTHVFPTMKVGWGTYPSFLGHEKSPGCFRCHDDEHKTAAGEVISQDCSLCHNLLATEEANPEILQRLRPE